MSTQEDDEKITLDELFDGQAWLAEELAERLEWSVERVRRKMIQLENYGLVKHVREGRYNWYFSTKDYLRYLEENPEQDITDKLKK